MRASKPSPKRSATRPINSPRFRPRPTWACRAAIRQRSPVCGNGETVVDLGSGGGLDVFLAAAKVGPTGKAIGIDMTPEMLALARANAAKAGLSNVEFHEATIDKLPLADASVDCVISNCVINLAARQAGRLPRDRPRAEAGRTAGRERHCPQEAAARRDRPRPDGLRRLHRREPFRLKNIVAGCRTPALTTSR